MTFSKYYEIRDENRLRFASVYKVECEFYLRRLLQRLSADQKKPRIVEVPR